MKLSVVIAVYNEELVIRRVLRELCAALDGSSLAPWEIVVVDDGSEDATCREVEGIDPRISLIPQPVHAGHGAALKYGTPLAHGEVIAWTDGDGTYAARDLIKMVEVLGENDQVIGVRPCDHGSCARQRYWLKQLVCKAASLRWGRTIPDLNSGLRAFRREAVASWIQLLPQRFSCSTTATLAALNCHQTVRFIPIGYQPRDKGSKSKFRTVSDSLRMLATIWRLSRQRSAADG